MQPSAPAHADFSFLGIGRTFAGLWSLTAFRIASPQISAAAISSADLTVTEIILDTFGGHIAAVRAQTDDTHENEEMCYIYPDSTVRIFYSTEELIYFLEEKAKTSWFERVFTRPLLSGVVFAFLLVAICIIGFFPKFFSPEAFAILGSVVGVAAGFFFGSGQTRQ